MTMGDGETLPMEPAMTRGGGEGGRATGGNQPAMKTRRLKTMTPSDRRHSTDGHRMYHVPHGQEQTFSSPS